MKKIASNVMTDPEIFGDVSYWLLGFERSFQTKFVPSGRRHLLQDNVPPHSIQLLHFFLTNIKLFDETMTRFRDTLNNFTKNIAFEFSFN